MRVGLLRVLGAATAVYGGAVAYRPAVLARPVGLVDADGTVPPDTALLVRAVGWRDVTSGLAMLLAPGPRALAVTTVVRVALDAGDGVLFGTLLPGRAQRIKAAAAAGSWGALALAGLLGRARRT